MDGHIRRVGQAETWMLGHPGFDLYIEDSGATRRGGLPSPHYIRVWIQRSATRLIG
jgi:hypothetical protein